MIRGIEIGKAEGCHCAAFGFSYLFASLCAREVKYDSDGR